MQLHGGKRLCSAEVGQLSIKIPWKSSSILKCHQPVEVVHVVERRRLSEADAGLPDVLAAVYGSDVLGSRVLRQTARDVLSWRWPTVESSKPKPLKIFFRTGKKYFVEEFKMAIKLN